MNRVRPFLLTLPLLVAPLAFSVALGGERGPRPAPPAPRAVERPEAARVVTTAPVRARIPAPIRLAESPRPTAPPARPVELPRELRSESFRGPRVDPGSDDDGTVDYSTAGDPERTERTAIAATVPGSLDDYVAAPE